MKGFLTILIVLSCQQSMSIATEASIIAAKDSVVIFNISKETLDATIKDNKLTPLDKWHVYITTSFPQIRTPECIKDKKRNEPTWKGGDIRYYRITNSTERGIYFLYDSATGTLIISYDNVER